MNYFNEFCPFWRQKLTFCYIFSGIDTRMKFSVQPLPGDDAFQQWNDAMKAVARLPMGIPPEFRKTVSVFFCQQIQ